MLFGRPAEVRFQSHSADKTMVPESSAPCEAAERLLLVCQKQKGTESDAFLENTNMGKGERLMSSTDPIALLFGGLEKLGPSDNAHTLHVLRLLPRQQFRL